MFVAALAKRRSRSMTEGVLAPMTPTRGPGSPGFLTLESPGWSFGIATALVGVW
jgi:hypothetical protein